MWAFEEIFAAAVPLALPSGVEVRIPTIAGYAAAKVGAWLDRSEWHETKDAGDLALAAYWYEHSTDVHDRLGLLAREFTIVGATRLIDEHRRAALEALTRGLRDRQGDHTA